MSRVKLTLTLILALMPLLLIRASGCQGPVDPPDDGSVQIFYQVNVDGAGAMGLADLASFEIITAKTTAKLHSDAYTDPEFPIDPAGDTLEFPAVTQLITGDLFPVPAGFITQFRVYPTEIEFNFTDGSSLPVRLPSGSQTGWKVVVDEEAFPDGYEVRSKEVTGIVLFLTLRDLFHKPDGHDWMARPTIQSDQYEILHEAGYEPDKIVVVFDPATSQATMDNIISGGNFTVDFRYPKAPHNLYKLHLPPNWDLQDAHSYLRGFSSVRAAAPSVVIGMRQVVPPNEGTPPELDAIGANTGWSAVEQALGTIGSPDIVLADVNYGTRIDHQDLWENVWLNEGELLPVCGDVANCDADGDGFITPRDFNHPDFPAEIRPPDWDGDGRITAEDLLETGGPGGYVNGVDDDGNGFVDDLAGWNFDHNVRFVKIDQSPAGANHETAVAGIMGAVGNNNKNTAGVTWNCRIMPIVAFFKGPQTVAEVEGATDQLISAFRYATENGAHVVNLSAGADMIPSNGNKCLRSLNITVVDKTFYDAVIEAMDDVISATFAGFSRSTPLFVLAGGECSPGVNDESPDYHDWPPEAFGADVNANATSIVVAATANVGGSPGPLAPQSNFGAPFAIAAPGVWTNMLSGTDMTANNYSDGGTSFAAPVVAGIAALIASGDLAAYATPNGVALKSELLASHTSGSVSAIPVITMLNLP